jgi:hypothetical protein
VHDVYAYSQGNVHLCETGKRSLMLRVYVKGEFGLSHLSTILTSHQSQTALVISKMAQELIHIGYI